MSASGSSPTALPTGANSPVVELPPVSPDITSDSGTSGSRTNPASSPFSAARDDLLAPISAPDQTVPPPDAPRDVEGPGACGSPQRPPSPSDDLPVRGSSSGEPPTFPAPICIFAYHLYRRPSSCLEA
ncbi:uncharacterized protein LOC144113147 isoform X1 [Amblyomma americanum]